MVSLLLPSLILSLFSFFTLFGIRPSLAFSQASFFAAAIIAFIIMKKIGRRFFRHNSLLMYWLLVAILIITYIIGLEVKGSKRWIDLYFFHFQASEFLKIFFIMFLADFFSRTITQREDQFISFIQCLFYFVLPTFIIFKQPDLGNAIVYAGMFFILLLMSDLPKRYVLYTILLASVIFPLGWFFLHDYQRDRILSFINPSLEQQGNAYNMIQALITVGSGGLFGKGLGVGSQSRLSFLPENNTDFAFASLIEQFGFFAGFIVIMLYAWILIMLGRKAWYYLQYHTEDTRYKLYYIIGIMVLITIQVSVNIGMNIGLLPIAGIALPFISSGGSLQVALFMGFALIP